MTDDDDIDMLAAEFALGTLEADEREAVARRRGHDAALDHAIRAWEERLAPLLDDFAPETAPAGLKERILEQIADPAAGPLQRESEAGSPVFAAEVTRLRRQVTGWRAAAAAGYALAAGLAALAFFAGPTAPTADRFVAVFQSDDAQPEFIMSIDLETREVVIRPVTAKPAEGKTYQLWIASDRLGGAPRSLGLLQDGTKPIRRSLPYDADLLQEATFGISLEPQGGSPTGRPTGRAIHGRLISADL